MSTATHSYTTELVWTGNRGEGTSSYRAYDRAHEITVTGKPTIPGSSDPHFRGDATRYNPEELLVASLSACHMLWVLHLCADTGIRVESYADAAVGTMQETADGGGHFTEVVLRPVVSVAGTVDHARMDAIHERAHQLCFIASSVSFPVRCEATLELGAAPTAPPPVGSA
jgi:organic hydroperoxide reductase OsmC/OhrA